MATYYHGATRRRSYFEGWYLKHQTQSGRALSLIPALHIDAEGRRTASLQVITENACWWLEYPELLAEERRFRIQLGENLRSGSRSLPSPAACPMAVSRLFGQTSWAHSVFLGEWSVPTA